jgi:D-glycero-alpha-D-manno-heptose-7-phosphate kinase
MIISKTPLRISFFGGGTDFPSFYENNPALVLSTAINRYVYIILNKRFDDEIRASYSKTEVVSLLKDLEHPIIKQTLNYFNIFKNIEIISIADIHSKGTGLGSSSAFTVGLINSISHYLKQKISKKALAELACHIEINLLKEPIGKQDQYASVFGGFNKMTFNNKQINIEKIKISQEYQEKLNDSLLFFYTGMTRKASQILSLHQDNIQNKKIINSLKKTYQITCQANKYLHENRLDDFGNLLNESWHIKKEFSKNISNDFIDDIYNKAINSGALGGKILGAGNGGFLMFYAPKDKHENIKNKLNFLKEEIFKFEKKGSKILRYE